MKKQERNERKKNSGKKKELGILHSALSGITA